MSRYEQYGNNKATPVKCERFISTTRPPIWNWCYVKLNDIFIYYSANSNSSQIKKLHNNHLTCISVFEWNSFHSISVKHIKISIIGESIKNNEKLGQFQQCHMKQFSWLSDFWHKQKVLHEPREILSKLDSKRPSRINENTTSKKSDPYGTKTYANSRHIIRKM